MEMSEKDLSYELGLKMKYISPMRQEP